MLSVLTLATTSAYANHIGAAQDKNFKKYCVDYQYVGQPPNPNDSQCEDTIQACEQRRAEFAAREDLQPITECYKADIGQLATVYCVDYQYVGQPPNPNNADCYRNIEDCEQHRAELAEREDIQPITECYKHKKQYVNFSEHPYLEQYR